MYKHRSSPTPWTHRLWSARFPRHCPLMRLFSNKEDNLPPHRHPCLFLLVTLTRINSQPPRGWVTYCWPRPGWLCFTRGRRIHWQKRVAIRNVLERGWETATKQGINYSITISHVALSSRSIQCHRQSARPTGNDKSPPCMDLGLRAALLTFQIYYIPSRIPHLPIFSVFFSCIFRSDDLASLR